MLGITQMALMVIAEFSVFFGAEYLYRFVWKRRKLKRGDFLDKSRYTTELGKFTKNRILLVLAVFAFLGLVEITAHSQQVAMWLLSLMGRRVAQVTTGMLVVIVGLTASSVRRKHLVGYGLTEIGFGFVGGIVAAGHVASADNLFPALVALVG